MTAIAAKETFSEIINIKAALKGSEPFNSDMAKEALDNHNDLPERYWKYDKLWIILGSLAFPAIMIVFYIMVFKPV